MQMSSGRLLTLERPLHPSTLELAVHPVTLEAGHLMTLEPGHPLTLVCWLELLWLCLCWYLQLSVLGSFLSCGGKPWSAPLTTWGYCHLSPSFFFLNMCLEVSPDSLCDTPMYGFALDAGKVERAWRSLQWSWLTWQIVTVKRNRIQLRLLTTSAMREFLVS